MIVSAMRTRQGQHAAVPSSSRSGGGRRPEASSGASAFAADSLRQAFKRGELRPNDAVREETWAAKLDISRTPVREAITELVADGLLTRKGRTAYVFDPSLDELLEIYDIRIPLELLAAVRCAESASDAQVKSIRRAEEALRKLAPVDRAWADAHEDYHLKIIDGAGMPHLSHILRNLRIQSEPYLRWTVRQSDQRFHERAADQHRLLAQAVADRDGDQITELVTAHLEMTRAELTHLLVAGLERPPVPFRSSYRGQVPHEEAW
jgi:DNA-binding GntR family transcriptional regulator